MLRSLFNPPANGRTGRPSGRGLQFCRDGSSGYGASVQQRSRAAARGGTARQPRGADR